MINGYLGPISHHFWDTATYWFKMANFCTPLSFSTLDRGDPFRILGKALQILKLESPWQSMVKILRSYLVLCWHNTRVWQMDEWTPQRRLRRTKHYMMLCVIKCCWPTLLWLCQAKPSNKYPPTVNQNVSKSWAYHQRYRNANMLLLVFLSVTSPTKIKKNV